MGKDQPKKELLEWVSQRPELMEKLERMRALEEEAGKTDLEGLEGALLELVRGMGAESLARSLEAQEGRAHARAKQEGGGREHGKKN